MMRNGNLNAKESCWLALTGRAPTSALVVCLLLVLGAPQLWAQTNTVSLGKNQAHPTRILAKFKHETDVLGRASELSRAGSKVNRRFKTLPKLVLLDEDNVPGQIPAAEDARRNRLMNRIEALKRTGFFEYVEPDYLFYPTATPTDAGFQDGRLWGLRNVGQFGGKPGADISATNAWDLTTGSTNVIVGVIDTGVRYTHRDLASQMWRNPGEIPSNGIDDDGNGFIDDVHGINAVTGSGDPYDAQWDHGTHVSGTIGAAANTNGPAVGVAWQVRIMALKFLDPFGFTADAITCVDYGVDNGARVLNNSWGGGGYSQALFDAIERARVAGVLFVAAAGNDGLDNDVDPHYPANYQVANVISVAALDRRDELADFSDYGADTVHIGAPGVSIFSCYSGSDTEYATIDGTSMAAPHVSGVAALILSHFASADLDEIRGRILGGAVPIPALAGKCTTGARLNAYNSLTLTGSGVLQQTVSPPSGSTLLTSSAQPIFVTVTDPPFSVADATVTANVPGVGDLVFANDGNPPDAIAGDKTYTATLAVPASTNTLVMTVASTAPGRVGATNVVVYEVVPPPPNDYFTNATKVPAGGALYRSNNRFATLEPSEPEHADEETASASLWWSYTPTVSTNVFVDTSGSAIDTLLAVYTGNGVGSLTPVAATNDVLDKLQAYLSFHANAGTTYRIALANTGENSGGSVQLRVTPGGHPDSTPPLVFVTSPLSGTITTNGVITVMGTATDPSPNITGVKEVHVGLLGAVGGSASGTTTWSAIVSLQEGLNAIQARAVDGFGNLSSPVTFYVTYFIPGPPNDFFVNGLALNPIAGGSTVDNDRATKEVNEPSHAGNNGGKSVWWNYTAPQDGVLTLSTWGSSFDTMLAIYQGNSVSTVTPVASNDDADPESPGYSQIVQAVRSNQTYRVAVDGFDGLSGTVLLTNYFTPATVYRLTLSSTPGGTVTPFSTDVASNATVVLTGIADPNYQFNQWNGSIVSLNNPLSLVVRSNMNLTGEFGPIEYTDGFESGNLSELNWTTAGEKPWVVQTNVVKAGAFAARSGIVAHGQSSRLILTEDYHAGNGSFSYKVSSEPDFDTLQFYLDGVLQQEWSGEAGWAVYAFAVSSGTHTLEWRYTKDASLSVGSDAAFIDNLNLPLVIPPDSSAPAHLQLHQQTDGIWYVDLTGQNGQTYVFQHSSNLVNWQSFSTNIASGGTTRAYDYSSQGNATRYYRAFVPVP